jgi:hypothetical protein
MLRHARAAKASRRKFIERMGLGAGALVLAPIANTLLAEAQGQPLTNSRAVFCVVGNGITTYNFTPQGLEQGGENDWSEIPSSSSFAWPRMLRSLETRRFEMLLLDGLSNELPMSQHSGGYGALSCVTSPSGQSNEYAGPPGGITIDQHIAQTLGAETALRSVLFGVDRNATPLMRRTFALGPNQPAPHFGDPQLMYKRLFGPLLPSDTGVQAGPVRRKAVLDALRGDIGKLQQHLAGVEKAKLDQYLGTIEEFETRAAIPIPAGCAAPTAPSTTLGGQGVVTEDLLDAMTDMAIVALTCGMTRVLGIALGTGFTHGNFPIFRRIVAGTQWAESGLGETGHDPPEIQGPAMDLIHDYGASLLSRIAAALAQIPEGTGSALDNCVMVYTSDNGEAHHSGKRRWPVAVLGSAGGRLKTGAFRRFPVGSRSLADFWLTIAAALDVPAGDFAKGTRSPVAGPLEELLA